LLLTVGLLLLLTVGLLLLLTVRILLAVGLLSVLGRRFLFLLSACNGNRRNRQSAAQEFAEVSRVSEVSHVRLQNEDEGSSVKERGGWSSPGVGLDLHGSRPTPT
jgi:hypothetical protein